jgi:hypothetical protein
MPKDTQHNTFFSWPKEAVTISTLPEQTHNNITEMKLLNVKMPEQSHNINHQLH